jgi:hypothetical protein
VDRDGAVTICDWLAELVGGCRVFVLSGRFLVWLRLSRGIRYVPFQGRADNFLRIALSGFQKGSVDQLARKSTCHALIRAISASYGRGTTVSWFGTEKVRSEWVKKADKVSQQVIQI